MPTWLWWLGWLKGCLFSPLGFVLQLSHCLPTLTNFCVLLLTQIQSPLKEGGQRWHLGGYGLVWELEAFYDSTSTLTWGKGSLLRKAHLDLLAGMLLINELGFVLIQLVLLSLRSAKWGLTSFPSSTSSDP